jgi:tRNA pseudouridine55 synthase
MARDLGARLGVGAHLAELRRERIGPFAVTDAAPLTEITGREPLIAPVDLLSGLRRVEVSPDEVARLRLGQRVGTAEGTDPTALVAGAELIAVAEPRDGRWQPVVVMAA